MARLYTRAAFPSISAQDVFLHIVLMSCSNYAFLPKNVSTCCRPGARDDASSLEQHAEVHGGGDRALCAKFRQRLGRVSVEFGYDLPRPLPLQIRRGLRKVYAWIVECGFGIISCPGAEKGLFIHERGFFKNRVALRYSKT